MTDQPHPADIALALNIAAKAENFMGEVAFLAHTLGTNATAGMVFGEVLSLTLTKGTEVTREQWLSVYDTVRGLHDAVAVVGTPPTGPLDKAAGPAATADATTSEEAAHLAEHWGDVISGAAFDLGDTSALYPENEDGCNG